MIVASTRSADTKPTSIMPPDIATLKHRLDELRPLRTAALAELEHFYDVQLTYTSNAIEGNTLTYSETAIVIEKGITIGGKPLADHLEAVDLYQAILFMRSVASSTAVLNETLICDLHARIVARSRPDIAGVYSPFRRRVAGSTVVFPNPAKVPSLMKDFGARLAAAPAAPESAFDAHLELVSIHPFSDGNGRTTRLLTNLLLVRGGYPPVAIGPEHREAYISAIESAQLTGDTASYSTFMSTRLADTMEDYIAAIGEAGGTTKQREPPA